MTARAGVPVDVGRDDARRAAAEELADPVYAEAEPSLPARVVDWIGDRLADVFGLLGGLPPGGGAGLLVLAVLLVVLVVVIRLRAGRIARPARLRPGRVFDGTVRTAAAHRQAAEAAQVRGDADEAVREWFRAIVRSLEERGVLDERSGRTATEAATEAGRQLPAEAAGLRAAAALFDDVHYGGRHADLAACTRLAALEEAVRGARPRPVPR